MAGTSTGAGPRTYAYVEVTSSPEPIEGEETQRFVGPVPATTTEDQYVLAPDRPFPPYSGEELTLPGGATYGTDRGFGWKHIDETTTLSQSAIGHAIENPTDATLEAGELGYVIGEHPADDGEILLRVLDGIVISAQETTTEEQLATDVSQQYEVSHQAVEDRLDGDPDQCKPSDPTGTEYVVEYYELEEEVLRVIGIQTVF